MKSKKIIGSDIKAYLNDASFKINEKKKPRVFANTLRIKDKISKFDKSIFLLFVIIEQMISVPMVTSSKSNVS